MLQAMSENRYLKLRLLAIGPYLFVWSGRYAEVGQPLRDGVDFFQQSEDAENNASMTFERSLTTA